MSQIYLEEIYRNLPRMLSLFDGDSSRESYGVGDRYRWAWGLKDFANGTFQGAAHGLARLVKHNLLPEFLSEHSILERIDAMFSGAHNLLRKNGSLEEAFPFEGSYCVTALVAYDLTTVLELLKDNLDNATSQKYFDIIRPMIAYLANTRESHAFISNHLATAAAVLIKWSQLTGEDCDATGQLLLQGILTNQSDEGWYLEYEGADPGYQSLCTYYLADIYRMTSSAELLDSLSRSLDFLWHFAHPDGSFGGLYGSRNTRIYCPAGIEYLAPKLPQAAALALFMRKAILDYKVVTLSAMDESNLVPMFNAYCWAAVEGGKHSDLQVLPCRREDQYFRHWPDAGLIVDRGQDYYTVISTHKGGVVYHFINDRLKQMNPGVLAKNSKGMQISTQSYQKQNNISVTDSSVQVESCFCSVTRKLPNPFQFLALRFLNVTVMRNAWCRELVKKILVRMLITGRKHSIGSNVRTITLGHDLLVKDKSSLAPEFTVVRNAENFVAIHMASQGYWQKQDDEGVD